ncbi:MAG: triose-phosphate isomerase [Candidatus Omnitrophica bacterium]|nr:triose-phosphate isomerase [Candidatus Omnitrophota bacterium]
MRKPLIAGNWKMNNTLFQARELINSLRRELIDFEDADILICPPFTALSDANDLLIESNIKLGAQNLYWQEKGAFTGEVSPLMLKDIGCSYVIIGHSERRNIFSETNQDVNRKTKAALSAELTPIICVGEVLDEREAGKTIEVVKKQLEESLADLDEEQILKSVIAYEPVWAIGTGKTATPQQAQEVHKFIRTWLKDKYCIDVSQQIRILYGGSVKPSNIKDLMSEDDVDGGLVGGASLDSASFVEIVKNSV